MGGDIQQQWDAIRAAPVLYLSAVAVVTGIVWLIINRLNAIRFAELEGRLRLRDDEIADYKRKLDGASPEEAAALIAAAEAKIALLGETIGRMEAARQPRLLAGKYGASIVAELAGLPKGGQWGIMAAAGDPEAYKFAEDIRKHMASTGFLVGENITSMQRTVPLVGHKIQHEPHPGATLRWVMIGAHPER